jgi:hypothetical protein
LALEVAVRKAHQAPTYNQRYIYASFDVHVTLTGAIELADNLNDLYFAPTEPCFGGAACSASGVIMAYDTPVQVGTWEATISATPVPAALPLFAGGLGALGLLGWRRKRKNASALAA